MMWVNRLKSYHSEWDIVISTFESNTQMIVAFAHLQTTDVLVSHGQDVNAHSPSRTYPMYSLLTHAFCFHDYDNTRYYVKVRCTVRLGWKSHFRKSQHHFNLWFGTSLYTQSKLKLHLPTIVGSSRTRGGRKWNVHSTTINTHFGENNNNNNNNTFCKFDENMVNLVEGFKGGYYITLFEVKLTTTRYISTFLCSEISKYRQSRIKNLYICLALSRNTELQSFFYLTLVYGLELNFHEAYRLLDEENVDIF